MFFPVNFIGLFYNEVLYFFKLPNDKQHHKRRTDIKFDVSVSFSGATLCFFVHFRVDISHSFTLISDVFLSRLKISSTANDAPR